MSERPLKSVLIVEDLTTDARLIERALFKARITNPLVFATDGQEAIDYLAQLQRGFDPIIRLLALIILDVKLPKRDGFEVLQWIRQHAEMQEIPVIVLTSSNLAPDEARASELGADAYLVKPIEPAALRKILLELGVVRPDA